MAKRKEIVIVDKLEQWGVADLIPYEKNSKVHDEKQIDNLVANFRKNGFDVPIVVDEDGVILKGHGRRLAAKKAGMKFVPVIVREGLSAEEKVEMRISDNLVARGEINEKLMLDELKLLADSDFEINFDSIGLNNSELESFADILDIDIEGLTDELDDLVDDDVVETADVEPTASTENTEVSKDEPARPVPDEYEPTFSVVVECDDEAGQEQLYKQMIEEGRKCKILSM